jgi:hypothetical protein
MESITLQGIAGGEQLKKDVTWRYMERDLEAAMKTDQRQKTQGAQKANNKAYNQRSVNGSMLSKQALREGMKVTSRWWQGAMNAARRDEPLGKTLLGGAFPAFFETLARLKAIRFIREQWAVITWFFPTIYLRTFFHLGPFAYGFHALGLFQGGGALVEILAFLSVVGWWAFGIWALGHLFYSVYRGVANKRSRQ